MCSNKSVSAIFDIWLGRTDLIFMLQTFEENFWKIRQKITLKC